MFHKKVLSYLEVTQSSSLAKDLKKRKNFTITKEYLNNFSQFYIALIIFFFIGFIFLLSFSFSSFDNPMYGYSASSTPWGAKIVKLLPALILWSLAYLIKKYENILLLIFSSIVTISLIISFFVEIVLKSFDVYPDVIFGLIFYGFLVYLIINGCFALKRVKEYEKKS